MIRGRELGSCSARPDRSHAFPSAVLEQHRDPIGRRSSSNRASSRAIIGLPTTCSARGRTLDRGFAVWAADWTARSPRTAGVFRLPRRRVRACGFVAPASVRSFARRAGGIGRHPAAAAAIPSVPAGSGSFANFAPRLAPRIESSSSVAAIGPESSSAGSVADTFRPSVFPRPGGYGGVEVYGS